MILIRSTCSKKGTKFISKAKRIFIFSSRSPYSKRDIKISVWRIETWEGIRRGREREREMGLALKGNGSFDFNQINVKTGLIKKNHTAKNGRISGWKTWRETRERLSPAHIDQRVEGEEEGVERREMEAEEHDLNRLHSKSFQPRSMFNPATIRRIVGPRTRPSVQKLGTRRI